MTVQTTFLPKTNGMVFGERLVARADKGRVYGLYSSVSVMPPLNTVAEAALEGEPFIGGSLLGTPAVYEGGPAGLHAPSQFMMSDNGVDGWEPATDLVSGTTPWRLFLDDKLDGKYIQFVTRVLDHNVESGPSESDEIIGPIRFRQIGTVTMKIDGVEYTEFQQIELAPGTYDLEFLNTGDGIGEPYIRWVTYGIASLESANGRTNRVTFSGPGYTVIFSEWQEPNAVDSGEEHNFNFLIE